MLVEFVGKDKNIPVAMSKEAAGMDVRAASKTVIAPHTVGLVPTGVRLQIVGERDRKSVAIMNLPRSSICKKNGLVLVNSVGLIDADYTGDIGFQYLNMSDDDVVIEKGERIGQIIFNQIVSPSDITFIHCEAFSQETERGDGAFGSSGKF